MKLLKLFFLSLPLLLNAANENNASMTENRDIDFSMVISGGVSLGAYESGYNWAMLKGLAKIKETSKILNPTLRSVSGASAGSINALLTAMYWCQKDSVPYENEVEDNLFYETWVNLGLEDLMIQGEDPNNKSTLFSRRVLRKKAAKIMEHMGKNIYREGCEVPIGFAVTKVTPIIEEFQGIKIKNQNFSVPLSFEIENGKVHIKNKTMPQNSTDFHISIPNIEKDYTKVVDVLFASSAFPGAFQQIKLQYKYKGKVRSNYFMDGGAYDNIPLQLATELNTKANLFIFMDPNNMRKERHRSDEDENEEPPVGFLTSSVGVLTNTLEIFQQMKLYQAINQHFRGHPERKLILSSRYHPLTAGYLEHFGAFLDKNFRMYDYYVGVYDAIYHLAVKLREKGSLGHMSQTAVMDHIMQTLDIDKNHEAYTAYEFFKSTEFKEKKIDKNNRYAAIYYAFNTKVPDNKRYTNEEFKTFLGKLNMKYLPQEKGSFLSNAKKDISHWARRPLRYVINRISTLENDRAKMYPEHKTTAKVISIGAWAGGSMLKEKDGWDVLPINAPHDKKEEDFRNLLRLIPTEFSTDTVNGGFSFAYEAYYYRKMSFLDGLDFKLSYNFNDDNGDFLRFDASAFAEFDDFVKVGAGVSTFGNVENDFYDRDSAYGTNVYIDIVDIFRMTYVRRYGAIEDNNYFYIGIENIPSLIYWLNR